MTEATGALVIGGNLNGLSIARSLGRHGIPVWVTTPANIRLASCSRYTQRTLPWLTGDGQAQAAYLLELAERYQLDGWVLFPTSDESAALLSKFHSVLSRRFRVSTPAWDVLRWAYDKRLTYQLAAEQEVDFPLTFYPGKEVSVNVDALNFPVILKPATHEIMNRFTADKAWPAANREELFARYYEAVELLPPDLIVVQELIPGGGESQFSYAALCCDGEPIASLTARRTRQFPIDFGYSSSFVETLDLPGQTGRMGVRWVRMSTDVPSAIQEILRGRLSLRAYLSSLHRPIEFAVMALDDPLPGLSDLPLFLYKHLHNRYKALRGVIALRAEKLSSNSGATR